MMQNAASWKSWPGFNVPMTSNYFLKEKNNNITYDFAKQKMKFAGHLLSGSAGSLHLLVTEGMEEGRCKGRQRRVWGDQ